MTSSVIWVVIATFVVAVIATGWMRRYALRRNLIDIPNSRSSHAFPTPRGGGVAIVIAFFAGALLLVALGQMDTRVLGALLIGGGTMAFVGYLDDRWRLLASVRFGAHLLAALWVVIQLGGIPETTLAHWGIHGALFGCLFTMLVLVWIANLFNFMDGVDGIASTEAVFVGGAGAWLNWSQGGAPGLTAAMLCLAAASLGFLRWNWPPARIFMGDAGSGFLGFSLAVLGLAASQNGSLPFEVWAILGGVFLVDATVTLIGRVVRGERWFEAHRSHAYQRLARRWRSHLPVTVLVIVINVFWLLPWVIVAAKFPYYVRYFLTIALAPLVALAIACGAGTREK